MLRLLPHTRRLATAAKSGVPLTKYVISNLESKYGPISLQVKSLPSELLEAICPDPNDDLVTIKLSNFHTVLEKEKLIICPVDESTQPPIYRLSPAAQSHQNRNWEKYGVNLGENQRGKLLTMKSTIDDHMLTIRVKQATGFLAKSHVVLVVVKFKSRSGQESNDEQQKIVYDQTRQRFKAAFGEIPGAEVQFVGQPNHSHGTLILKIQPKNV